jgi:polyphosphate kinase
MPRNLYRRVEIAFPIVDLKIKQYLIKTLDLAFKDNVKARVLTPKGKYYRKEASDKEKKVDFQDWFINFTVKENSRRKKEKKLNFS